MDIRSSYAYPAGALSTFRQNPFFFDDVLCGSMQGLLEAFKFSNVERQREVCRLVGESAKLRARGRNKPWMREQKLWWQDVTYDRHGPVYQWLLDRAFYALLQNEYFRTALLSTEDVILTYPQGRHDPHEIVLTEREFVSRLMKMRSELRAKRQPPSHLSTRRSKRP